MLTKIQVEWQYTLSASRAINSASEISRFFNISSSDHYSKSFSLTPRYQISHRHLTPRSNFLGKMRDNLLHESNNKALKLPFKLKNLKLSKIYDNSFLLEKVSVDIFNTEVIVLRIRASLECGDLGENFAELSNVLYSLRLPKKLKAIDDCANLLIRSITNEGWRPALPTQTKFAFKILLPIDDVKFRKGVDLSKRNLIASHIGTPEPSGVATSLVQELERTWRQLNLKSQAEWMLANAQGITYLTPENSHGSPHPNRFERSSQLLAIASYFQLLLLDPEDLARLDYDLWITEITTARRWIQYSKNALYSSVSNQVLYRILIESLSLDSLIDELISIDFTRGT